VALHPGYGAAFLPGAFDMTKFFKSLRRSRGDHRQVFAEFALTLMYLRAEMAVRQRRAGLRVVG
jgi:hypothetical protein